MTLELTLQSIQWINNAIFRPHLAQKEAEKAEADAAGKAMDQDADEARSPATPVNR